jgi:hypothetical protein
MNIIYGIRPSPDLWAWLHQGLMARPRPVKTCKLQGVVCDTRLNLNTCIMPEVEVIIILLVPGHFFNEE